MNEILSRQARLEQRGAIVAALAETEARNSSRPARRETAAPNPPDALSAIQALGPPTSAGASVDDTARAYAPLPDPRSLGPSSLTRSTNRRDFERPALGGAFHDRKRDWSRGRS